MDLRAWDIAQALAHQGIRSNEQSVQSIEPLFEHAVGAQLRAQSEGKTGSSVVGQDAVEIAVGLELDARTGAPAVTRAIQEVASGWQQQQQPPPPPSPPERRWGEGRGRGGGWDRQPPPPPPVSPAKALWYDYFDRTASLAQDMNAAQLFSSNRFEPVKLSWEDMNRYQGSTGGPRIADVGLWGRRDAADPSSAQLLLTVRRDENFRDGVLLVPSKNIRLHYKVRGRLKETTLPQRLRDLGLLSPSGRFDTNVVVSNQFSIVPVPRREHVETDALAFNFSIRPYGSPTYVMADMMDGTSEVVASGRNHQLLYFDDRGNKAPFTAARASDRGRVVAAVRELKRMGVDVDVQRFYLVQVPLRQDAPVVPGNMGRPPTGNEPGLAAGGNAQMGAWGRQGAEDVVLGHGQSEGPYQVGTGFQGQRADERVRVTVSYFITPVRPLTQQDMDAMARKFREWDKQAVWGGSFVRPEMLAPAVQ